ncbi:MAG: hypothetical protein EAY75_16095 [Bacteroidetes bacterium]|nr:MAG: hypothetical protein EAY75_16095 [Bacteroidota bacterium]
MLTRNRFIVFVLTVLAAAYALPWLLATAFKQDDFTKIWWLWNKKKNGQYKYAVIGNSASLCGIDSKTLADSTGGEAINLSISDSDFSTYYIVLAYFLAQNHNKIENLLVQVSLGELGRTAREDDDNLYNFIPYLNNPLVFDHFKHMYPKDALLYKYLPITGYTKYNSKIGLVTLLNSVAKVKRKNFNAFGDLHYNRPYAFSDTIWNGQYADTTTYTDGAYSEAFTYLGKIKRLAKAHGVKNVIMFSIPVLKQQHVLYINDKLAIRNIQRAADSLQLHYLNTTAVFPQYDFHRFVDRAHLSQQAAIEYTQLLSSALKQIK